MMILASCQDIAKDTAKTATLAADSGYPSLHTVPPRPRLSYPVEQRRAIVDGLIADRENARYTSEVIRYRSGLTSMPPPEPKTVAAVPLEAGPEAGDTSSAPAAGSSDRPGADVATEFNYEDDDLGSFIQDMLDDAAEPADEPQPGATGEPEARAAPPEDDPVPPDARPRDKPVVADGGPTANGARVVPATMVIGPPATARQTGTTTASNERLRPSPPPPAPGKPPVASATEMIAGSARRDEMVRADRAALARPPKPVPETAQIEVAGGLVAIEVAPEGDRDTALGSIAFGPGSAALPPDARAHLEQFLGGANAQGARIKIVGEADAPALALDRARAVGLALVQSGVPADRLEMSLAHSDGGDRARLFLAAPAAP